MQGSALENKQMMRHNIGGKGGSQLASKGTYEVITAQLLSTSKI
jgi:hypothetical protein